MQRRRLQLSWHDEQQVRHSERVTPVDLVARNGEEFLRAQTADGQEHVIRLDRIMACRPLARA